MPDDFEALERRCPRLGGPVAFGYCRGCGEKGRPCFKIIDCWWEIFDVQSFLQQRLSPQEFARLLEERPKPKVLSLVELIEQARKRTAE